MTLTLEQLRDVVESIDKSGQYNLSTRKQPLKIQQANVVENQLESQVHVYKDLITTSYLKKMLVDVQLEQESEVYANSFSRNIHASEVYGCLRYNIFKYFGLNVIEIKTTFKSVFYTMFGNIVQTVIENMIKLTDTRIKFKKFLSEDVCISGEIDAIYFKENDGIVVVEIKTVDDSVIDDANFAGRHSDWRQLLYYVTTLLQYKKVLSHNYKDIEIMSNNLSMYINQDVKYCQLWYVTRNFNINCISLKIDVTDSTFKDYIEYYRVHEESILNYISRETIPALSNKLVDKSTCNFCMYKKYCYSSTSEIKIKQIENYKSIFNRYSGGEYDGLQRT
jgi:Holliday junction resolvase-like predicted endonuclease